MRAICRLTVVVTLFLGSAGAALADLPPLIPRSVLFGNPERMNPQVSPDGKHLAYGDLVPGLHIQTVDTGDTLTLSTPPDLCFR